jgi:Tfp pilus assembly protein PilF
MSLTRSLAGVVLAGLLAAGCASGPFASFSLIRSAGMPYLEEGIRQYEEGNYRVASRRLQFALEEGLPRAERVSAHKYLAFIACVSGQQLTCREEFAIALELDPAFELEPAEAGHPIWGPVYKSVKTSRSRR